MRINKIGSKYGIYFIMMILLAIGLSVFVYAGCGNDAELKSTCDYQSGSTGRADSGESDSCNGWCTRCANDMGGAVGGWDCSEDRLVGCVKDHGCPSSLKECQGPYSRTGVYNCGKSDSGTGSSDTTSDDTTDDSSDTSEDSGDSDTSEHSGGSDSSDDDSEISYSEYNDFDPTVDNWYDVEDWELDICSTYGGVDELSSDAESALYGITSSSDVFLSQTTIALQANKQSYDFDNFSQTLYTVSWYIQAINGSVDYQVLIIGSDGEREIGNGTTTSDTAGSGYFAEYIDKTYEYAEIDYGGEWIKVPIVESE